MTGQVLFSDSAAPYDWSEATSNKLCYGPKGALLATLPRKWTLPFALIPTSVLSDHGSEPLFSLGDDFFSRLRSLAPSGEKLLVRSSVIAESIWDRGTYESILVDIHGKDFASALSAAARQVIESAKGKDTGLVVQQYLNPRSRGEFGNLLRISKTRDHWELSAEVTGGATSRSRFNTQRDESASPLHGLAVRSRQTQERLFGSIAAWFNSYLLRGRSQRLNCEWVADQQHVYLVQLDEEDEDYWGVNPFQLIVSTAHTPKAHKGKFLAHATNEEGGALKIWDKLKVLDELWEADAKHRPMLFYVPLMQLPATDDHTEVKKLEEDFQFLIGKDNIVVRTSVRAGSEKLPNLPRTECVSPRRAAEWCVQTRDRFLASGTDIEPLAFVAHRFIGARASAWVRAEPANPIVEIHSLWGLPDALQYCPYDIWDVHTPTEVATEYAEYKSNILIPGEGGSWEYVRVKNELARSLCIGRREAIDLAHRSTAIVQRLGRACHIMWFIDCVDEERRSFSIPWYWTEAHEAERNVDRSNYRVVPISDLRELEQFLNQEGGHARQAIELRPTDQNLMRDDAFIEAVGEAAKNVGVPVILAGSTLAHAYYQLRRQGCTIVALGEKSHSRIRRVATFGKIVRDKIPTRIAQRQETEVTRAVPHQVVKGFLTSKLLEEVLEFRNADTQINKSLELADLFEVVRALAKSEGITIEEVVAKADKKRESAGGFDDGLILLQTGIVARTRDEVSGSEKLPTQVLARRLSGNSYEIPFTFFGFMEMDQPRSIAFEDAGARLDITLKADRIELRLSHEAEQLELPLETTTLER